MCVTCGKRFLDKQTLDEHGVTHLQVTNNYLGDISCRVLCYDFATLVFPKSQIKPFQCHICLKQLTRRSRLRMHLRAHEEELSPTLVLACSVCYRPFRDSADAQVRRFLLIQLTECTNVSHSMDILMYVFPKIHTYFQ